MGSRREQKLEKFKKPDKATPDAHREFLDMDTDEEDFGRQETPEIEEELPPEPERPVFTEQDLLVLIRHVKNLVVLPSLKDEDWTEDCYETIREYFRNPSHSILTVYKEETVLRASLSLPDNASRGFTYFSRTPWQVYDPENFLSTVSFGSFNENVGSSVLKFMENIYAPVALDSDDWPQIVRDDLFLNLHELLLCLTKEIYESRGFTVLYVPKERLLRRFARSFDSVEYFLPKDSRKTLSEEDKEKEKLAGRLEMIVRCWTRQIRGATKTNAIRKNVQNVLDEVNYWKSIQSNLINLRSQLLNEDVSLIIEILRNFRSPSVESFEELSENVDRGLEEASSNLMYLNILSESCKELNVPEDVEGSVTRALLLILFVWTESPFYNSMDCIETVCRALSTQIIHQCENYIKLDVAFGDNPEEGIKMIEKCIVCCDAYRLIYDRIVKNVTIRVNPSREWNIDEEKVFGNVETFKQRCYDVIDICKALIVFGRCNKVGSLGSPKGMEYELQCRKIENLFYKSLHEIVQTPDVIFDVTKCNWLEKIQDFRYTFGELENMAKNLMDEIFEDVRNIEEGIEAIYALQKFGQTENLAEILENKWTQVWKMFSEEIEFCYLIAIKETDKRNRSMKRSDIYANVTCLEQYLKNQSSMMTDASDWIGECSAEKCILEQYKRVLDAIDSRKKSIA